MMTILTAVVLLIAMSRPAHAYIDAGSGSYMLQMSMAGVLAVVFSLKVFWTRIRAGVVGVFAGRSRTRASHKP